MPSNICTAIDIGSSYTKVVVGNNKKVKLCGLLKTPEGSVRNNMITDVDAVAKAIKNFLGENKIYNTDAYFAIHGQDIVVRHLELPLMNVKSIRSAVEYEINQYLPDDGANHYVDFEIIEKINTADKKAYKLMVVAVPRFKVDKYLELSKAIGMNVKAIDISSNCAARVFREKQDASAKTSTGILDIGYNTSDIIILENGKLFIEREFNFGIANIVNSIAESLAIEPEQAYQYLFEKFSFTNEDDETDIHKKIVSMFNESLNSFEKIIQFYTTGKLEKTLGKIYIIGGGSGINGIDFYYGSYFNTSAYVVDNPEKLPVKVKFPVGCDLKVYINSVGLVMRKDQSISELNLLPHEMRKGSTSFLNSKQMISVAAATAVVAGIATVGPMIGVKSLEKQELKLQEYVNRNSVLLSENEALQKQLDDINAYVGQVDSLRDSRTLSAAIIRNIEKYIPAQVILTNLNYVEGTIQISATSSDYNAICIFSANLQTSEEFSGSIINSVTTNNTSDNAGGYITSITISFGGGEAIEGTQP